MERKAVGLDRTGKKGRISEKLGMTSLVGLFSYIQRPKGVDLRDRSWMKVKVRLS